MKMVTIGIPTYNRKNYLLKALNSALRQNYSNIEIVISDNHSDDGTEELMNSLIKEHNWTNVKYLRQECNRGAEANWMYCLNQAQGDFFLMLSDDDVLEENAIENLVNGMHDNVVLVIGQSIHIDEDDKEISCHYNPVGIISGEEFWYARLEKGYHDTPSGVLYQLSAMKKVIKDITVTGSTIDVAMNLLLAKNQFVNCIDNVVFRYRIHGGADSLNIMRCVNSHIALIHFMKTKKYSVKQIEVLKQYCRNTVWSYAIIALKEKKDIFLAMKCINSLYGSCYKSNFMNWGEFLLVIGIRFLKRKLKFL